MVRLPMGHFHIVHTNLYQNVALQLEHLTFLIGEGHYIHTYILGVSDKFIFQREFAPLASHSSYTLRRALHKFNVESYTQIFFWLTN